MKRDVKTSLLFTELCLTTASVLFTVTLVLAESYAFEILVSLKTFDLISCLVVESWRVREMQMLDTLECTKAAKIVLIEMKLKFFRIELLKPKLFQDSEKESETEREWGRRENRERKDRRNGEGQSITWDWREPGIVRRVGERVSNKDV